MPATVHTVMFKGRERPLATHATNGEFALTLRVMDDVDSRYRESWLLTWSGADAQAWWQAHGASLQPGQPIRVHATRIRAFAHPRGAEIHAQVLSLALEPWRHQPAANQATQLAERAAA